MRLALVAASLVLVGGMTAACGGGAPSDASTDEFCDAWKKASESVMSGDEDFDKTKSAYEDAFEVGTPDGISDDAREGFEVMEDAIADADSQKDLEEMEEPSEEDSKKVDEFTTYLGKECADAFGGGASEAPAE